jgi:hypothetical protein
MLWDEIGCIGLLDVVPIDRFDTVTTVVSKYPLSVSFDTNAGMRSINLTTFLE